MFGSDLIQWAIKVTTGKTITDPTSGMRAFNKRMIAYMANGLNYGPEPDTVSYLIKRAGAKVVEVPVEMQERQAGESYLRPWSSAMYMMPLWLSQSSLSNSFVRRSMVMADERCSSRWTNCCFRSHPHLYHSQST